MLRRHAGSWIDLAPLYSERTSKGVAAGVKGNLLENGRRSDDEPAIELMLSRLTRTFSRAGKRLMAISQFFKRPGRSMRN